MAGAWGEHVVEVRPVGDVEAVILLDDGRRPVSTLVTPDATWPVASALRVGVAVLERLAHRPPDGTLPAIHADSVWLSKADEAVALVPTGDDPRYWAPERFAGRGGDDERIAFYALGVLLFHMLTGQRPFDSATAEELAHAHAARRPPDLRALRPEVPAIVATLVSRLLAKDRAGRYQSRQGAPG